MQLFSTRKGVITVQNGKIQHNLVVFSGNNVGFISCGTATVDEMFQSEEMERWLQSKSLNVVWKEGIYLRLVETAGDFSDEKGKGVKAVRIWRLGAKFPKEGRFLFLREFRHEFGEPSICDYEVIFQEEMGTDNLETIYSALSTKEFSADSQYPLTISDVIELYDLESREFYFIDRYRFEPIDFLNLKA